MRFRPLTSAENSAAHFDRPATQLTHLTFGHADEPKWEQSWATLISFLLLFFELSCGSEIGQAKEIHTFKKEREKVR